AKKLRIRIIEYKNDETTFRYQTRERARRKVHKVSAASIAHNVRENRLFPTR
ncbi:unnamed protein product, partial [marine sediment metagenome]